MIDKIYIVSFRGEQEDLPSSILDFNKTLEGLGLSKEEISVSSIFKGDLLHGDGLETVRNTARKIWKGSQSNRSPFKGEIACALNHISCWKDLSTSEHENALIIEDDSFLLNHFKFKEDLENILRQLEDLPSWDLCFIGTKEKGKPTERDKVLKVSEGLTRALPNKGAKAYLLKREGAKTISNEEFSKNVFNVSDYFNGLAGQSENEKLNEQFSKLEVKLFSTFYDQPIFAENKQINEFRGANNSGLLGVKRPSKIKFYTAATKDHDGLDRLRISAEYYGIDLKVIGLDSSWSDGDVARLEHPGGGQKINILKRELENLEDDDIILFVDGYDVVFLTGPEEIEEKWNKATEGTSTQAIFGSEKAIWPDDSIADKFPTEEQCGSKYRFLNSGNFIGRVKALKEITEEEIPDSGDDQLYYQHKFLSGAYGIQLDYKAELFQCIAGCADGNINGELEVVSDRIRNEVHKTNPCVFHGNGSKEQKIKHNWFCNYVGGPRLKNKATMIGQQNVFTGFPTILISLFLEQSTTAWECIDRLKQITSLTIPKENIFLCISYDESKVQLNTDKEVEDAFSEYKKVFVKRVVEENYVSNRDKCLEAAFKLDVDYYFYIDDHFIINKQDTIENLLFVNKTLVAPLGKHKDASRDANADVISNYWGATDGGGWYAQSQDYEDIVKRTVTGVWAGPYVFACYLLNRRGISSLLDSYGHNYVWERGSDMSFCSNALDNGVIPYLDNRFTYGNVTSF